MTDYKDRLAGSPTAVATAVYCGTQPQLLYAADDNRISINAQAVGDGYVGPASTMTASACFAFVASGALFEERDYRGALFGKSEGATVMFRVSGVRY